MGDKERLCAVEPRLEKILSSGGARTRDREISRPALIPLSYRGSHEVLKLNVSALLPK